MNKVKGKYGDSLVHTLREKTKQLLEKEVAELHIRKKFFISKKIQKFSHPQRREKDLRFTKRLPLTWTGSYIDTASLGPHCSVIPNVQNNQRTERGYSVYSRSQSKGAAEKMWNRNLPD